MQLPISLGNQGFASLRENHCFYIDKTDFIREWWEKGDSVTLITRPRRFGKTLTMSMVEQFFSVKYAGQQNLFEGLAIWKTKAYREIQGTYPVISLSFANLKEPSYELTRQKVCDQLQQLYTEHAYIWESGILKGADKSFFERMLHNEKVEYVDATLALYKLSSFMYQYYGKKVLILLDEYDTPMQEAYINDYWNELTVFMRSLLNAAFKTNPWLERAIMTGITRVSKESIFSDLNNLKVITTTSDEYADAFGFTEKEVFEALEERGLGSEKQKVKEWYDGYRFGNADVYCPWDVINYCDAHRRNPMLPPENYWTNTSGNDVLKHFIESAGAAKGLAKTDLERLVNGEIVEKDIREDLTYNELYASMDNLWSTLFMAGYLTHKGRVDTKRFRLAVPNREIRNIITEQVLALFKQNVEKDGQRP